MDENEKSFSQHQLGNEYENESFCCDMTTLRTVNLESLLQCKKELVGEMVEVPSMRHVEGCAREG
jgi:hypothetical protein